MTETSFSPVKCQCRLVAGMLTSGCRANEWVNHRIISSSVEIPIGRSKQSPDRGIGDAGRDT